jgi:hypothetical protein
MKRIISLLAILCGLPLWGQICLDFEDFAFGTTTSGAQENISFGVGFVAAPVLLPDGSSNGGGNVSVGDSTAALNSGQALNVNNAAVEFCLPGLKEVSFRFSNQGGYFNFSIDGSEVEVPSNEAGSFSLNDVNIVITGTKTNSRLTGEVTLTSPKATFECFSVGGQELQIDDVCFLNCENPSSPDSAIEEIICVEFEGLEKQGPFEPETAYIENGLVFEVTEHDDEFQDATESALRQAGHLGKEFHFENAGFSVTGDCWSAVKFHFFTKSAVEMTVNGITVTADSIRGLDGETFGEVAVVIQEDPDVSGGGIACLVGRINSLALSGEDFYLDHFCAIGCPRDCIDFEGEVAETKYIKGDTIAEDGFTLSISDPQDTESPALISIDNEALASGNELQLNGGLLDFGKTCFRGLAFQYGQYEEGLTLTVDGDERELAGPISALDGETVGDMVIEVYVTQAFGNRERGVVRMRGDSSGIQLSAQGMSIDRVCIEECPDALVVGFGEEPVGENYGDGETFTEDGIEFTVCKLRINDEALGTIVGDNETGGTGQAIALEFATLKFDLLCASALSFQYANFGANGGPQGFGLDVRLSINGESSGLVQGFPELDGTTLGGATINADPGTGRVSLTGPIERIIVGGFNIQLDNIAQTPFAGGPNCHDFNAWDPNLTYGSADELVVLLADGTAAFFTDFVTTDGQFLDGTATVANEQNAGGSGRELTLDDSTANFQLLGDWSEVSFRFSDLMEASGREVSLDINGDVITADLITDFDGQVFTSGNGQEVTTLVLSQVRDGRLCGIVKFSGLISTIGIGGEGLVVDNLCGTKQPAPLMLSSRVVSVEKGETSEITYVWDIEALNVQDSDFLIRRSDLSSASFQSYSGNTPAVTSHGGDSNFYRVTKTKPIEQDRRFYRVELRAD